MRHDRECEIEIAQLNSEIQTCRDIIATQTEQFDRTSAFHNGMYIEHGHQTTLKHELCKELRAKFKECYEKLKELEGEMCGLLKIRQAVYNKIKNPDGKKPQLLIQDCMMSDWVVGECWEHVVFLMAGWVYNSSQENHLRNGPTQPKKVNMAHPALQTRFLETAPRRCAPSTA